ncbi:MAG: flagellar biosynthesis protein FlhA [Armatimonadota bacterium]
MVGVAAVAVMGMLVMPMPPWLLDLLLTLNFTGAVGVLLVSVYTTQPLQFASFPSMLLVSTLFRLALNISATRLILLNGDAGSLISAFGSVVVGGNYVVGLVVFIILVIIQFVVITNGTGRVAEVAARFTLDAMPGKQMAIDADLNAGIIDEKEAQNRRAAVSREADFYGAMDGASKFVRGDAIAAVVTILVNILGGFLIGVVQRNMDFITALQTYTLLTVGEGLLIQIPALLISTAAGLMVTRAASEHNLGVEMAGEIFSQPRALSIAAAVCGVLVLIPGLPKMPFVLAAAGGAALTYVLKRQVSRARVEPVGEPEQTRPPEQMTDLLGVDPIELELGYGLIPLADAKQGGDLLERITSVRRQAALELGLLVPAIRVRDNMQLKPNAYRVKLRGIEIASGEVYPGRLLAMNPGAATGELRGTETVEPAFGLPAVWISEAQRVAAEIAGYTVVDPITVLITHLSELIRRHADTILTRQDTQVLVDTVKQYAPVLVEELLPGLLSLGDVQRVLQNLLAERVPIRDLQTILEELANAARLTKDPDALTEYVRSALCRQITRLCQGDDGVVRALTLTPALEQTLADGIRQTESGAQLVLAPDVARKILEAVRSQVERMAAFGHVPVVLCSPRTRVHFRRLVERMTPNLWVLSYNEISPEAKLETVGTVSLDDEGTSRQIGERA